MADTFLYSSYGVLIDSPGNHPDSIAFHYGGRVSYYSYAYGLIPG